MRAWFVERVDGRRAAKIRDGSFVALTGHCLVIHVN